MADAATVWPSRWSVSDVTSARSVKPMARTYSVPAYRRCLGRVEEVSRKCRGRVACPAASESSHRVPSGSTRPWARKMVGTPDAETCGEGGGGGVPPLRGLAAGSSRATQTHLVRADGAARVARDLSRSGAV